MLDLCQHRCALRLLTLSVRIQVYYHSEDDGRKARI